MNVTAGICGGREGKRERQRSMTARRRRRVKTMNVIMNSLDVRANPFHP